MAVLFTKLLACSVGMGLFITLLTLTASRWSRMFAAKWSVYLWALLAACLCVPLAPGIPAVEGFFARYAWIPICWLIVAGLVIAYGLLRQSRFRKEALQWSADPENNTFTIKTARLAEELNMSKCPVVKVTTKVTCPTILGLGQPVLLLPHEKYSDGEFDIILRHEFFHYLHGHVPYKIFLWAVSALHWFNPAVWLMRQKAAIDLEEACDDALLADASEKTRRQYSETILSVMQSPSGCTAPFSTHTYGSPTATGRRLVRLLSAPPKTGGIALLFAGVILAFLSGTVVATAAALLEAPAAETVAPSSSTPAVEPDIPRSSATEPAISEPETESSMPEPEVSEPEPESSTPEPEVSEPEDESSPPEPEASEPEDESSSPEPEASEPEADLPEFPIDALKEIVDTLPNTLQALNAGILTTGSDSASLENIAVPGEKTSGMPPDDILMVVINRVIDAYNSDTADTSMSNPDAPRLMPMPASVTEIPNVTASEDFIALPRTSNGYSIVVPIGSTGIQMQIWVDDNGPGNAYLFDIVAVNFARG